MDVQKLSVLASPFVGVFCKATDNVTLAPRGINPREKKMLEVALDVRVIETTLAHSALLGVLCLANSRGIVVSSLVDENEIRELKQNGLQALCIDSTLALGNLISINDSVGITSPLVPQKMREKIKHFLGIRLAQQKIAGSDLVGSNLVLTNRGFVANPNASNAEIAALEKTTGLKGKRASANFGDVFVGNSVIANSSGAVAGQNSTPHEMLAIEDALLSHPTT